MEEGVSSRQAIYEWLARSVNNTENPAFSPLKPSDAQYKKINEPRNSEAPNVAKGLRLHTPFQHIEGPSRCKRVEIGVGRKRKRRQAAESTSELSVGKENYQPNQKPLETSNSSITLASESQRTSSPDISELYHKHIKPDPHLYARKRRRKTKEDRYVLKENVSKEKKCGNRNTKLEKNRRPKRKGKSGAAPLHTFSAANVASARLTLKPLPKVGLFTKGRASSPYRRRALPDLSFSELKFLGRHQRRPEELEDGHNGGGNSKKRRRGLELDGEFSKFFATKESPLASRTAHKIPRGRMKEEKPQYHSSSQIKQKATHPNTSQPSLPPVEFPGRPFLGFGRPASQSISSMPLPRNVQTDHSPIKAHRSPFHLSTRSQFSWSQSQVTPRTHAQRIDKEMKTSSMLEKRLVDSRLAQQSEKLEKCLQEGGYGRKDGMVKKTPKVSANEYIISPRTLLDAPRASPPRQTPKSHEEPNVPAPSIVDSTAAQPGKEQDSTPRELVLHGDGNEPPDGFMQDLNKLLKKWSGNGLPALAVGKSSASEVPAQEPCAPGVSAERVSEALKSNNEYEKAFPEKEDVIADEAHEHSQQPASPRGTKIDLEKHVPPFNQVTLSDDNPDIRDNPQLDKGVEGLPSRVDQRHNFQGFLPTTQENLLTHNKRPLLPFPNPRARYTGPNLFMSPDSIYQRQIHEQEGSSNTARVSEAFSQHWFSAAEDEWPSSRSILRPKPRPLSRPPFFRPSSGLSLTPRNLHSRHHPAPVDEQYSRPPTHYRTPSRSNLSPAASCTDFPSGSAPRKQILSASREADPHPVPESVPVLLQSDLYENDPWQQAADDRTRDSTLGPAQFLFQNASHPTKSIHAMPRPYPRPDSFGTAVPTPGAAGDTATDALLASEPDDARVEAKFAADYAERAPHGDFPVGFWMPNKLY